MTNSTIARYRILGCAQRITLGFLKTCAVTLCLVLNYYTFSISLTFYNKIVVTVSLQNIIFSM